MSTKMSISLIGVSLGIVLVLLYLLKKDKIPVKYSMVWFVVSLILLCCAFLPVWMVNFTELVGFKTPSNFVIGVLFILVFVICIVLTCIVSGQNKKITLLVQELSILKSKVNKENEQKYDGGDKNE